MSLYKNTQIGFQTSTLPFGLYMLQARLASAHSHGVGVDRNGWRRRCGCPAAPALAVGLPAATPAAAPLPALPARRAAWLEAASLKASTACASTVKLICVSLFPATAFVLLLALVCFGEGALAAACQLAGDKCTGTGGALESWYPVPSELSHLHRLIRFQETNRDTSITLGN